MKYASFLLLLLIAKTSIAQQLLLFESKIYFEDAAGNRDTIEIGYDTTANSYFNPLLGEKDLKNAFNPEFEVRASHPFDWESHSTECILSKKIIGACERTIDPKDPTHICYGSEGILFFIKTKHEPVKIYWDRKDFEDKIKRCNNNSFFTPDYNYHIADPLYWVQWPDKRFACASKEDQFVVNMDRKYIDTAYSKEYTFATSRVFSNGIKDTILGVEWLNEQSRPFSPCLLISQTENSKNKTASLEYQSIYPNPVSTYLLISNSKNHTLIGIQIFDQFGHLINKNDHLNSQELDTKISVEKLEAGIYFIQLRYADNFIEFRRFLKM